MIFAGRRNEGTVHPFILKPQHHHHVRAIQPFVNAAIGGGAQHLHLWRQQCGRRDGTDLRPQRRQAEHVGAGDAAVQHIAADRDHEAFKPALAPADGERVQQGLGGMLVPAVPGIENGTIDLVRDQGDRARTGMADDDDVGGHGVERHCRVDQRFALLHAGGRGVHVDDIRAQPLARDFERQQGAGAVLEKGVDLRHAGQPVVMFARLALVGLRPIFRFVQQEADFPGFEVRDRQKMPMREQRATGKVGRDGRGGHGRHERPFRRAPGSGQERQPDLRPLRHWQRCPGRA